MFGKLSPPFRSRFDLILRLDYYPEEDLLKIVKNASMKLNLEGEGRALREVARRARGTPRIANRLLKRVRAYGGLEHWDEAFEELGIDSYGLDDTDRKLLRMIRDRFSAGPVGLATLAASFGDDEVTISDVYEPFLLQQNFIQRTPKGRV